MRPLLRIALLWLIALAIPVQGIAAASMAVCGPSHARMALADIAGPHDHASHGHGAAAAGHDHAEIMSEAQHASPTSSCNRERPNPRNSSISWPSSTAAPVPPAARPSSCLRPSCPSICRRSTRSTSRRRSSGARASSPAGSSVRPDPSSPDASFRRVNDACARARAAHGRSLHAPDFILTYRQCRPARAAVRPFSEVFMFSPDKPALLAAIAALGVGTASSALAQASA